MDRETGFERLVEIVGRLRAPEGCPWDREQTHSSLKAACVEEAAEVVGAINLLEDTGKGENLKEELGDLLLQVVMQAAMAEEEGLFDIADVVEGISQKMIRRHPHVFAGEVIPMDTQEEMVEKWEEMKKREKASRPEAEEQEEREYLQRAFTEAVSLIQRAQKRKGFL